MDHKIGRCEPAPLLALVIILLGVIVAFLLGANWAAGQAEPCVDLEVVASPAGYIA